MIIEEEYPFLTEKDVNERILAELSEWKGGSYSVLTGEEFRSKLSFPLQREGIIKKPRLITQIPEQLIRVSKIPKTFKSPRILLGLRNQGISKKQLDDIEHENILWDWKRFLGVLYCIYDVEDARKIFLFLTDVLKKKDLYDAFSTLASGPKEITDEVMKRKMYNLKVIYGLVESDENVWRPKKYTPFELTKNIKRICKRENAPKELIKILNWYKTVLLEDKERMRKVSEMMIYSERGFDCDDFAMIKKFLKEKRLNPSNLTIEDKSDKEKASLHFPYIRKYSAHLYCPHSYEYSLKHPGLTYGVAEELASLLEDEFPVKNVEIIL